MAPSLTPATATPFQRLRQLQGAGTPNPFELRGGSAAPAGAWALPRPLPRPYSRVARGAERSANNPLACTPNSNIA